MPADSLALARSGLALIDAGRFSDAIGQLRRALTAGPERAEVHHALGRALLLSGKAAEAWRHLRRAIALAPHFPEPRLLWAQALLRQGQLADAIDSFRRAVQVAPHSAAAHFQLGGALALADDTASALASYESAIALDPAHFRAHLMRGWTLRTCGRLPEAQQSLRTALTLQPDSPQAIAESMYCCAKMCAWSEAERLLGRLREVPRALDHVDPLVLMAVSDDPAEHARAARTIAVSLCQSRVPLVSAPPYRHERIRVAYLSRDYFEHATAFLMAELLELHDRAGFEIFCVSFGPGDGSAMRRRIERAPEHFMDLTGQSEHHIAGWLRAQEIDIVVDLKGYSGFARSGILALRPAAIQVSYLGFPGTMAAPFIDYLIADEVLIGPADRRFYSENIAYLPASYQVNDRKRTVAERTPTRAEEGLPERGFVFCCFNNNWKITAPVFDVWMRLLSGVEGSVLWMLADNDSALTQLRREAAGRGVDPKRLVFCRRKNNAEHLARHRLADLFLDTLPCNAHTTASDALWSGVPIVTCTGRAFASRVGASLLYAVGLDELVTHSAGEYQKLALTLALDPQRLSRIRTRLTAERCKLPLFDTPLFCRHLERAYRHMWLRHQNGKPPETFSVEQQGLE